MSGLSQSMRLTKVSVLPTKDGHCVTLEGDIGGGRKVRLEFDLDNDVMARIDVDEVRFRQENYAGETVVNSASYEATLTLNAGLVMQADGTLHSMKVV